ncbi:hypothetical protein H4219_000576 [Mycoemilia scoparia]|uniref:Uncharacterized protein n=1 Tax=Mycoemilia scoparia TaxID=417184 RepID=A0A9W8AAG0_9FUNG|nr:hypothetical protein H4219_000576 [Mycoemilia scoparia]
MKNKKSKGQAKGADRQPKGPSQWLKPSPSSEEKDTPSTTQAKKIDKHDLYEQSVQTPKKEVRNLETLYRRLAYQYKPSDVDEDRSRPYALSLREDFCGTAALCAEWVSHDCKRWGIGVDIDPEVINYGLEKTLPKRRLDQGDRITLVTADVSKAFASRDWPKNNNDDDYDDDDRKRGAWARSIGGGKFEVPPVDIIASLNYSMGFYHKRADLIRYLKHSYNNLEDFGILVCDIFGGMDSYSSNNVTIREFSDFRYKFEQKNFDLATNTAQLSISYRMADGTHLKDAFAYTFRVYTPFELKEAMLESGFKAVSIWMPVEKKDDSEDESSGNGGYESGSSDTHKQERNKRDKKSKRGKSNGSPPATQQGSNQLEGFVELKGSMPMPEIFNGK